MKRNPIKTLKRNAWAAFSRKIRNRDPYCVTCLVEGKKVPSAHAGHYQYNTERNQQLGGNALWFDERNVHGQCAGCNLFKSGNLSSYTLYLTDKFGHTIFQEIRILWKQPKKWTLAEIEEIAAYDPLR